MEIREMKIETGIAQPYALSKEGQKPQASLAAEIASHNAACDQLSEKIQKVRNVDAAQWSASNKSDADTLAKRRAELLQNELGLRGRIADFFARLPDGDLSAARDEATKSHEVATSEVRAKLVAIGYVDDEYERTLVELTARHPRVRDAKVAMDGFTTYPHLPAQQENDESITRCQNKLAAIKESSIGILS
jgi:hypothetical protein